MRPPIQDTLRELVRLAKAAGAPDAWCTTTGDALVDFVLELELLRRVVNRRKLATLVRSQLVRAANDVLVASGATAEGRMEALCSRFGLSRSRIHALIRMSCDSQDADVLDSGHDLPKPLRSKRNSGGNQGQ